MVRDDSIAFEDERYRVDQLIDEARSTTVDEFVDAHIPLPGLHPSHDRSGAHDAVMRVLGALHVVVHLLTEEEREALGRILERSRHAPKFETRARLAEFTRSLRPELQVSEQASRRASGRADERASGSSK